MLDSDRQNIFSPGCLRSCQTMSTVANHADATNSQRCQPLPSARKEKAAPVLWARTMLKKPVMGVQSPSW
jgi:hypothetical protein